MNTKISKRSHFYSNSKDIVNKPIPNLSTIMGWEKVRISENGEELVPFEEKSKNRRLLYHIMKEAGFTNYSCEWWHYDFGNQFWGCIKGENAQYGNAVITHQQKIFRL